MIENDSTGVEMTSTFKSHFASKVLDVDRGPKEQILFARKHEDVWVNRDVTSMFFQASPISKQIADNYGTSSGTEVELVFDNTPFPVIYPITDTNGLISFSVAFEPYITQNETPLQADDWVEISDYNNIEQRRIQSVNVISDTNNTLYNVLLTEPLDNDFDVDFMEIRYLFAIPEHLKTRLDTYDLYNGYIQMNLGFQDESQYVTLYQGEVIGGQRDPNNTITLTTQDRVKSLVETQLTARFEVDDRGVASVPTPRGWNGENDRKTFFPSTRFDIADIPNLPNVGTGTISDIEYSDNKIKEIEHDDEWVLTYDGDSDRWFAFGSTYGATNTEGYSGTGFLNARTWEIDLKDDIGWSVTVNEGAIPFAHGDQFSFFAKAFQDDMCHIVKGRGFDTNPIETLDVKYLNPSYIIEFFVNDVLELKHEKINIQNGDETDLIVDIQGLRRQDLDFRTELRGVFSEGTAAIQVIDDALRAVNGWLYSTHDDHLSIFYYSPFSFGDYDTSEIHTDFDNPRVTSRYPNAANPQVEPRVVDSVKNQFSFSFANGEVFVDDADSQENFGRFKLDVRGEDLITHSIQSGYEMSENTARNAAYRALNRYKNPIFRANFTGLPDLLLLEIGDIPIVYSREAQFVNKPFWVTGLEVDFVNLTVMVTGELATQIVGKFGVAHEDDDPSANEIWDITGFIGSRGEERLVFVADEEDQLAILAGLSEYAPRFGKPDRWGNYVADAFIVA